MSLGCGSYCEHGGICEKPHGHDGMHDSGYCQWDDEHALTEAQADAVLAGKDHTYLAMKPLFQAMFPGEPL